MNNYFDKLNEEKLECLLQSENWKTVFDQLDINLAFEGFTNILIYTVYKEF